MIPQTLDLNCNLYVNEELENNCIRLFFLQLHRCRHIHTLLYTQYKYVYIFTLGECRAPPCHTVVLPAHCTTGPGRGSHVRCMGGIPEPFSETGLSL